MIWAFTLQSAQKSTCKTTKGSSSRFSASSSSFSSPTQLSQSYLIGSDPVVLWPHAVRLITWSDHDWLGALSLQPAQVEPGRTCPDRYHLPFIEGYSICFYHESVLWMIVMIIADMKTKNIYRALVRKQFTHPPSSNSLYAQFQCQAVFHYTLKSNAKQHSLHCDLFSFFCR